MDQYVHIMRKYSCHAIAPGRNIRFTYPNPLNPSPNRLSKQYSKGQHRTLRQPKPALQNPYTSFTLLVREAAELFIALSIIPSLHIAHPRRTARNSSHAISLTACGTMDKTLISNRKRDPMFPTFCNERLANEVV